MADRQVIVDGSNLATEGRSLPSLAQLDEAVREFLAENSHAQVTVVVDASFGHRIDPAELPMFEEAEAAGEVISPPAGAIGRGDAFLLRIAEKTGATVLSNDSFQEFHGEHAWLFDDGRLIGGKPVPGVGWIFMPRAPVRGQKSREVVKEAKRKRRVEEAADVAAAGSGATGLDLAALRSRGRGKKVDRAIARATEEAVEPRSNGRPRRRGGTPPAEPVNEPLAFITFIAAHPLGSDVVGTVTEFSSHGAFVEADGARCYLPLSAMDDPPPRRAREVVSKGDERTFVIQALDPQRRGIELALPGFARVAGGPTEETVEAEIHEKAAAPKRRRRQKADTGLALTSESAPAATPSDGAESLAAVGGRRAGSNKAGAVKQAGAAKKAGAVKKPVAAKESLAKKAGIDRRATPAEATPAAATGDASVVSKAAASPTPGAAGARERTRATGARPAQPEGAAGRAAGPAEKVGGRARKEAGGPAGPAEKVRGRARKEAGGPAQKAAPRIGKASPATAAAARPGQAVTGSVPPATRPAEAVTGPNPPATRPTGAAPRPGKTARPTAEAVPPASETSPVANQAAAATRSRGSASGAKRATRAAAEEPAERAKTAPRSRTTRATKNTNVSTRGTAAAGESVTSHAVATEDTADLAAQGRRRPTKAPPAVTKGAPTVRRAASDEKKAAGTASQGAAGVKKAGAGAKKVAAARSWTG